MLHAVSQCEAVRADSEVIAPCVLDEPQAITAVHIPIFVTKLN